MRATSVFLIPVLVPVPVPCPCEGVLCKILLCLSPGVMAMSHDSSAAQLPCQDRWVVGNYDCPTQIGNRIFPMLHAKLCAGERRPDSHLSNHHTRLLRRACRDLTIATDSSRPRPAETFGAHLAWELNRENPFEHNCDEFLSRRAPGSIEAAQLLRECPSMRRRGQPRANVLKTGYLPAVPRNGSLTFCGRFEQGTLLMRDKYATHPEASSAQRAALRSTFAQGTLRPFGAAFDSLFSFTGADSAETLPSHLHGSYGEQALATS